MAKVRCQYCDELIDDTSAFCPYCNAANKEHQRLLKDLPRNIVELSQWVKSQKLPEFSTLKFVVGSPSTRNNTYVCQKDANNFQIYYVGNDGNKQVKYRGSDEEYACGLFCQIVKDACTKAVLNASDLTTANLTAMMQLSTEQRLANEFLPFLWNAFKVSTVIFFLVAAIWLFR